jgi:hypothetical protein
MLSKRFHWRKLVAGLLGIVALLATSYLVVANVFLQTRLLRNIVTVSPARFAIDGASTDLTLEYSSAYSILPGRVHVEGLRMRGRERSVEWFFALDRADVSISLVDLLRRSFRATTVRSSGLAGWRFEHGSGSTAPMPPQTSSPRCHQLPASRILRSWMRDRRQLR